MPWADRCLLSDGTGWHIEHHRQVYVFDVAPPYRIIGVADAPLDLPLGSVGSGMVFTSNLAWAGDKIVIGYGIKDRTASFHVTDAKTLLASVKEV